VTALYLNSLFTSNTLTNPDQVVGKSTTTRQQLLAAIDTVFAEHGFDRTSLSDAAAPEVTAFGVAMHDSKQGISLKVVAAPSACGTGIVFNAFAQVNYGDGWEQAGGDYPSRFHHWSTSEKLIQFGNPRAMSPRFVSDLRKAFHANLQRREQSAAARKAASEVAARLGASKNGTLVGKEFVAQVAATGAGTEVAVELTLRTTNIEKVAAVLALLQQG
jgi:hypothetical protein